MDAQFDALGRAPREAEQLDAVAEFLGVGDVLGLEFGDAFDVRALELHRNAERDGREQRDLVPGVDALDVERRIGFRVAEPLRFGQHGRRTASPLARISERMKLHVPLMMPAIHSMRLAASPSRSALIVGMQPATAASNATITLCSPRRREDLVAVQRQQRFVGGDDVLAAHDRGQNRFLGDGRPPITSTTMSISRLVTTARTSSTTGMSGPDDLAGSRAGCAQRPSRSRSGVRPVA